MTRRPGTVSIIMPAWNAAETIGKSIESVLRQSYGDWELIVVDDGSTDSTSDVVASFADPRIHLFFQPNAGVAAARNRGIGKSSGEYVAFLDADDLWLPGKLAAQVAAFRSAGPELGLVHTRLLTFASDPELCVARDDDAWYGYLPPWERILVYDFIPTSTVMIRAEVLDEVGLFDEGLFGVEDWDLWIRVLSRYCETRLDAPLVKYRESAVGISKNLSRHLEQEWRVIRKHVLHGGRNARAIRNKAVFYFHLKMYRYLLANRMPLRLLKAFMSSLVTYPSMYCALGNYGDALRISWCLYRSNKSPQSMTGPSS